MARQSRTPVPHKRTNRPADLTIRSSARAGVVVPFGYEPVYRGESASGNLAFNAILSHMPKPLVNRVILNIQTWFVPKSAFPIFESETDHFHSYQGESREYLNSTGATTTITPRKYFMDYPAGSSPDWKYTKVKNSEIYKVMGLHLALLPANDDVIDCYNVIYNFRLAAHSSKLELKQYFRQSGYGGFYPAFWPTNRYSLVVPDYEQELVVGALSLDVSAGNIPLSNTTVPVTGITQRDNAIGGDPAGIDAQAAQIGVGNTKAMLYLKRKAANPAGTDLDINADLAGITAEFSGQQIISSLADIDTARIRQSLAKLRASYAGTDHTGYLNDDAIIAELMQGFTVPSQEGRHPWLLNSAMVPFGMSERFATDAENLEASVSRGTAATGYSYAIPRQDFGGYIMHTVEVLPERIYERQGDPILHATSTDFYPNALRDVQRPEPVDIVQNWHIDARHTSPTGLYGYVPMNELHKRSFTRLGGSYYQADPGAPWTEQRSAIWMPEIVNPNFTEHHYLAPSPFPHDVFSDTESDAFEFSASSHVTFNGLTQFGDVLVEDNGDFEVVEGEI